MVRPVLFAVGVALWVWPAAAQNRRDQYSPMPPRETNAGEPHQSFPQLAQTARAAAGGGTYIGSDFDADTGMYRFKFINNGRVTWVDIDGRSGEVVNVEGR